MTAEQEQALRTRMKDQGASEAEIEQAVQKRAAEDLADLKKHQAKIGTLYGADPNCWHVLDPRCYSGVRCLKCPGWYCA